MAYKPGQHGQHYHENLVKYDAPPSIERVLEVVAKYGRGSLRFFCRHYGLATSSVTHYTLGMQPLPAKYWHIFHEPSPTKFQELKNQKKIPPKKKPRIKKDSVLASLL